MAQFVTKQRIFYWILRSIVSTPFIDVKNCTLYKITRSRKIESDMDYQKNKEHVQELEVLWEEEKLHSTINKYIETFDINTITSFYFTNNHFKDFQLQSPFLCGSPFFISFLLSHTSLDYSTNLVRAVRRPISFHWSNPWGWPLKRGSVYLVVSFPGMSTRWSPDVFGAVTTKVLMTDHLLFVCSGSIKSWLFIWSESTSCETQVLPGVNVFDHISFFYFLL